MRPRRSRTPDPDARILRAGWAASIAGGVALLAMFWREVPVEALPYLMLFTGLVLLFPSWRMGRVLWAWLRDAPHAAWQGAYYEFDGHQVRILFDDDARVWIGADDVFDVFGLTGHARDPQRVRQIAGREGLQHAPGTRLLCFTEKGLRAWMERRAERHAAKFAEWLDKQVIGPYRRRLEIGCGQPTAGGL